MSGPLHLSAGRDFMIALMTMFAVACAAGDSPDAVRYSPDNTLERLQFAAVAAPEVGMIRDFDIAGDTLYLLDHGDVVHIVHRTGDGWSKAGEIGRRGAGPGEFRTPSGLAVTHTSTIVVAEAGRLQFIRPGGTVERQMRARPGGIRMTWPDALPAYIDRVQAGAVTVLLRPFTADSVVLQTVAPDSRDVAVAPLNGFVACEAAGCLWLLEDTEPARVILLDTARIQSLLTTLEAR